MRHLLSFVALLAFGLSGPAMADTTIRYQVVAPAHATAAVRANMPTMTAIASDGGNVRIDTGVGGQGLALITLDGVSYFVAHGAAANQQIIAKQEDLVALLTQFAPMAAGMASAGGEGLQRVRQQRVEIAPGGFERVAGVAGRVYRVTAISGTTRSPAVEVVLSIDPRVAPVGREFLRLIEALQPTVVTVLGSEPQAYAAVRGLLSLGTPIRIGAHFRLESVSGGDIAESRFALPGPVLSRAQLMTMAMQMGSAMRPHRPTGAPAAGAEHDGAPAPEPSHDNHNDGPHRR
jgi:hypothetical protein